MSPSLASIAMCTPMGRLYSHRNACQQPGPLQVLVDIALSIVTGLHNCAHLQLASPAVNLHVPGLTLNIGLHCLCLWQESIAIVVYTDSQDPTAVSVPTASPSPCSLPWPPPLRVCLQLAPATTTQASAAGPSVKCVHTNSSSQQCYLPWTLAARLGSTTDNPDSPYRL